MKTCTIPGCTKELNCRGLCEMHYARLRAGKDLYAPQKRATPGVPMNWLLSHMLITDDECVIWPFARHRNGYPQVHFPERGVSHMGFAHIKVCILVKGSRPSPIHEAAHSCGNGHLGCISPNHLSWKTPKENTADKFLHGTVLYGEGISTSKLTTDQVVYIRSTPRSVISDTALAPKFGVTRTTISKIRRGERWVRVGLHEPASTRRSPA